jgi:hypothetical protein
MSYFFSILIGGVTNISILFVDLEDVSNENAPSVISAFAPVHLDFAPFICMD